MTGNQKEKIYRGISLFCIVLCVWLIGQVAADELFGAAAEGQIHLPPVVAQRKEIQQMPEGSGLALGEEQIEAELRKYIPGELPLENLDVEIDAGGAMTLAAEMERGRLFDYLTTMGMELPGQGAVSFLLPDRLIFSAGVTCSCDPESGLITLTPNGMTLAGNAVDTAILPQSFWDTLGQAMSRLLLAEEGAFDAVTFGEGMIYLQ